MRNVFLYSTIVIFLQINFAFGQNKQILSNQDKIMVNPFIQEYHQAYSLGDDKQKNDVRRIAVDHLGKVWAGTKAGLFTLDQVSGEWKAMLDSANQGPVYDLFVDSKGIVWIAAWNGLFKADNYKTTKIDITDMPVAAISENAGKLTIIGIKSIWKKESESWTKEELPYSRVVRRLIPDTNDGYYLATGKGLYHITQSKAKLFQNAEELLSDNLFGLAYSKNNELWIGGLGGVTVYKDDERIKSYTPKEGLPNVWVRSIEKAPDGTMWVGTDLGIARYTGNNWSIRHSRRWLLSDKVRDIAFDKNGTAWVATANGVSAIKNKKMTLLQKADYYYNIMQKRHVRKPYFVEKCNLTIPGDTTIWTPRDDDNDGQYTSMYLVMESYRYAVTKNPEAKENATKAFEALKFLQTITETESFVARTVVPSSWTRMADANRTYSEREWAEKIINEAREKRIENQWILSKDKKWYWKRGTSSDEITGHMYGYLFYYDLVADKKEKKRVREHI
ncbi:MAG: regulator, partial [Bacteroidetes bacterium]